MKKRIVALLISIALVLCLIPPAMAEASTDLGSTPVQLDICDGSISIVSGTDTVKYTQGGQVYTSAGGCIVTQRNPSAPTSNRIDISADSEDCLEVKLTIAGIHINAEKAPIALLDKARVTLTLVGENSMASSFSAGIKVPSSTILTVRGSGSIVSTGGRNDRTYVYGAGIGGVSGDEYSGGCGSGTIIIANGKVTAVGGRGEYGGKNGIDGTVVITGGEVNVKNSLYGEITIDGGVVVSDSISSREGITINGGTVEVTRYGISGYNDANITITGGAVTSTSENYYAGIGVEDGAIIISGGNVTATGGDGYPGIGGNDADSCTIIISGGNVTATGGYHSAGVGGGVYARGGRVSISDAVVTAKGFYCAIGGGGPSNSYGCDSIDIGDNVTLELSYTQSGGSNCQERIYITQPLPSAALSGNSACFEAKVQSHSGIQSYQWQVKSGEEWLDVDGKTSAAVFFPVTDETVGSTYRCEITNVYGNIVYTDSVKSYFLAFAQQPESVETGLDEIAAFMVVPSCSNVTYQWQRSYDGVSWAALAGKTVSTLVVNTTLSENGAWYRCVITATNGDQLASEPARITVNTDAVTYSTDFYLEQADGSYAVVERATVESQKGASVTAPEKTFDHYTENTSRGTHSGTVAEDSSLVLSRYYDRCEYTLTFETDGGAAIAPITAKHGTTIELPANVSRYGYDFGGWYLDEELTEKAELTVMPTEDTTVYAKWTAVGADRGTEYHINGITLLGPDYQKIDSVPKGAFYAHVSVTNLCSEQMDTLILATYDKAGRMLDLYFMFADPQVGQTFSLGALIDNSGGEVAELRAFMIPLLGGPMIPLANSVSTNG